MVSKHAASTAQVIQHQLNLEDVNEFCGSQNTKQPVVAHLKTLFQYSHAHIEENVE
jgi:hypothetical protein